jgi:hypothetical protein
MSTSFDLNLSGKTIDGIDKSIGYPPDGYYVTKLAAVASDPEYGRLNFEFKISNGIHAGRKLKGSLGNPRLADNPEKSQERARAWAVRLGLLSKADENKTVATDYAKAIGRDVVVKVHTKPGTKGGMFQEVEYCGLWPLDHPDLDGPTRHALGLPLLPGQSAEAAPKGRGGKKAEPTVPGAASGAPATSPAQSSQSIADALFN